MLVNGLGVWAQAPDPVGIPLAADTRSKRPSAGCLGRPCQTCSPGLQPPGAYASPPPARPLPRSPPPVPGPCQSLAYQTEKYGVFDCKPLGFIWAKFPDHYNAENTVMLDDLRQGRACAWFEWRRFSLCGCVNVCVRVCAGVCACVHPPTRACTSVHASKFWQGHLPGSLMSHESLLPCHQGPLFHTPAQPPNHAHSDNP